MLKTLLPVLFTSFSLFSLSQKITIKGCIADSVSKQGLSYTTVSLVKANDSTLVTFSRADSAGYFKLSGIDAGNYLIAASYVGYSPVWFPVSVSPGELIHDAGFILMSNIKRLKDVTVTDKRPPVTINNDTLEFNTENFKTQPNAVVEDMLKKMPGVTVENEAVVTFITEGENFIIDADRMHITSVLYNLLDNALKYKKQHAEIEVLLKSHRMHVEIKVKDNGIGIPTEYKSRVFEKFFRVPTMDVHNTKGYGLGLSYVNHIIKRHLGYMFVESELGKGSTFTANIPYKEADEIWFDDKRCIRRKNIL